MKVRIAQGGSRGLLGLAAAALLLTFEPALSVTVNLTAGPVTVTVAGNPVQMWGFGLDANPPTVPGPPIVVPPGDTSLTINLTNNLPEGVSIVIPGQKATMTPVFFFDAGLPSNGIDPATPPRRRVKAFTAEAAPGGSHAYNWTGLKPGTFLYQSGSHPGVQVQMGLHGSLAVQPAAGQVYPGVSYGKEVVLVLSEVDPVLANAVASGRYGQPVPDPLPVGLTAADYPSSPINYRPWYFLVNGAPYAPGSSISTGTGGAPLNVNDAILVRFLNAGLRTHSMALTPPSAPPGVPATYFSILSEDGNPYLHARQGNSVFLPAGKTADAIVSPPGAGSYALQDRTLHLTNGSAVGDAGLQAILSIGAGGAAPVANDDTFRTAANTPLTITAPGLLLNDIGSGLSVNFSSLASHGTATVNADGSFTYSPNAGYSGLDSFTYTATNGTTSNVATATITVSLPPVAGNNLYNVAGVLNVAAPGILANDSSPDLLPLTAVLVTGPSLLGAGSFTLNADGSFSYTTTNTTVTNDSFTYRAFDGTLYSTPATVTLHLTGHPAPIARDDTFGGTLNTPVVLDVLLNDSAFAPATIVRTNIPPGNSSPRVLSAPTRGGSVLVLSNGTIRYTPAHNFTGTDTFTYRFRDSLGANSNTATVRVNVQ